MSNQCHRTMCSNQARAEDRCSYRLLCALIGWLYLRVKFELVVNVYRLLLRIIRKVQLQWDTNEMSFTL